MLKSKRTFRNKFLWLLSFGLTACLPQKLTTAEIVGTWIMRPLQADSGQSIACSYFVFRVDGRFEAHNIPGEYFIDFVTRIDDVSGSWELDTKPRDPFGWDVINMKFPPIGNSLLKFGFDSQLYSTTGGGERILFAWHGDESNRIVFVKTSNPCK